MVQRILSLVHPEIIIATGVVTSPNYPGMYPDNLEKTQTIQVEQGWILALEFTEFDMSTYGDTAYNVENHGFGCPYDHLTITDGDGTTLLERSCGPDFNFQGTIVIGDQTVNSSLPPIAFSRSNVVKIFFRSDEIGAQGKRTRKGWSVTWSALPGKGDYPLRKTVKSVKNSHLAGPPPPPGGFWEHPVHNKKLCSILHFRVFRLL